MKSIIRCFVTLTLLLLMQLSFGETVLWTNSHARLQAIKTTSGQNLNWIFLPGGPGLGSEYLKPFVETLNLPGTLWLLDLPGDGSNRVQGKINFNQWPDNLTQAVEKLPNVILVAHSFGGMLVLDTPQLKKHLIGLVLMDTASNHQWMHQGNKLISPEAIEAQKNYTAHPSDQNFKTVALATAPYFFSKDQLKPGKTFLETLPYNHAPFDWATQSFDPTFNAKWVPKKIPVLIIFGAQDILTPPMLFEKDPRFQRKNIVFQIINGAAHFPWMGHSQEVESALQEYAKHFQSSPGS